METLVLLFKLALALWLVYNVGVYAWRRRRDREASASFGKIDGVGRALTPQEHATLRSWLANPQEPGGMVGLLRDGHAFPLNGDFVRHGMRLSLSSTLHDTLGGVDVRLPYDANDFLQPHNTAEVVLTGKYAVVITLNARFDIAAGRARTVAANLQKLAAAHPGIPLPEVDPALAAADLAMRGFELLGQREETLAERTARSSTRLQDDILIGTTLTLAWLALIFGSSSPDDASACWISLGVAMLGVGAWRWARSTALRSAQTVHRLRGRLSRTALTDTRGPGQGLFILGRRFSLQAPFHWARFINPPPLDVVEMEVRVGDASLVRYRESLSIDAEAVRFPHRPARSMKGVGVAAAAALFFALTGYRHVGADFDRARALVAGPSAPAAVQAAPASVAAAAPGEDDAASAPAAPRCARDGCDGAHWAAIRAGVVVSTLGLALLSALLLLGQRLAAATRLRTLASHCDERTRSCVASSTVT